MKKLFLMMVVLCLLLAGCGQTTQNNEAEAEAETPEQTTVETEAESGVTIYPLPDTTMENLTDTTVVTVAQRVSSIKNADLILAIDDGYVIGLGTHEELMQNCESYREIATIQMGEVE